MAFNTNTDFAPDAFTFWFNVNEDRRKPGNHWAEAEIPVDEINRLAAWARTAEKSMDQRGNECVKLRANLRPKTSRAGNPYLSMAISDAKPKTGGSGYAGNNDDDDIPF